MERSGEASVAPSAVEADGSLVLWHPGHCGAIWLTLAPLLMLQGFVAFSLIAWRVALTEGRGESSGGSPALEGLQALVATERVGD